MFYSKYDILKSEVSYHKKNKISNNGIFFIKMKNNIRNLIYIIFASYRYSKLYILTI